MYIMLNLVYEVILRRLGNAHSVIFGQKISRCVKKLLGRPLRLSNCRSGSPLGDYSACTRVYTYRKVTFSQFFDPDVGKKGDARRPGRSRPLITPENAISWRTPALGDWFWRFAQYRHKKDNDVNAKGLLFPLRHGADAYENCSLIGLFGNFTAQILKELRSGRMASSMYWKWPDKLAS